MSYFDERIDISEFLGKVFTSVRMSENSEGDDAITFTCADGSEYRMLHQQDCCEDVYIEDVDGPLNLLEGSPVVMAEEIENSKNPLNNYEESFTWTFYKIGTSLGSVTIRWYGSSNGYYSERVDIIRTKEADKTTWTCYNCLGTNRGTDVCSACGSAKSVLN